MSWKNLLERKEHEYLHAGSFHHLSPCGCEVHKKNPVLSRTIIIRGDQTLVQLHKIIFKAFDRFDEHLYEFQIGGKSPQDPNARRYGFPSYPDEISNDFKLAGDVKQTTIDVLKLKQD